MPKNKGLHLQAVRIAQLESLLADARESIKFANDRMNQVVDALQRIKTPHDDAISALKIIYIWAGADGFDSWQVRELIERTLKMEDVK